MLFYVASGTGTAEQMLSDIRRNGSEPLAPRESSATSATRRRITRELVERVEVFMEMTETVRSTISNRSLKLFTLSAIYHATETLLSDRQNESYKIGWHRLAFSSGLRSPRHIPDWQRAKEREVSPAELRRAYIIRHAIALAAMAGSAGRSSDAIRDRGNESSGPCNRWTGREENPLLGGARAMIAGRLSKTNVSVDLDRKCDQEAS